MSLVRSSGVRMCFCRSLAKCWPGGFNEFHMAEFLKIRSRDDENVLSVGLSSLNCSASKNALTQSDVVRTTSLMTCLSRHEWCILSSPRFQNALDSQKRVSD